MSLDEATILAIESAVQKYSERYSDKLFVDIAITTGRDEVRDSELMAAVQDCAMLVCGHPLVSQYRWLDLFMLSLRERQATRLAVLTFINKFRDEVL